MILVDTNVVSEMIRPVPNPAVRDWFDRESESGLFVSAITEAELRYGLEIMPFGRQRSQLTQEVERVLTEEFDDWILPFDTEAARQYAVIRAARRSIGREIGIADCQIAAIARSRAAAIATRDTGGFQHCGIEVVNPWGRP